jgi:tRNA pseudouridine55 synthase
MSRRRRRRPGRNDEILQGVLLVDKPADRTSRDVCEFVKHKLRLGKVGHGGTLDPFATGLLPLLLNGATRLMSQLQDQDKEYQGTIRLGVRTDTMDPTGEVTARTDASAITDEAITAALAGFVGEIEQTVPRYSAARVDGKRLYEYARDGEEVELPTKTVKIYSIEHRGTVRDGETVDVDVLVKCVAGTYIRALADDIGEVLGVGGHLVQLRRSRNGGLSVDAAITLDVIGAQALQWREARQALQEEEGAPVRFVPEENARRWHDFLGSALIDIPSLLGGLSTLALTAELASRVASGQPLRKSELETLDQPEVTFRTGDRLVLQAPGGLRSVAIVKALCSRESLSRREPSAIVLQVERVLR